MDKHRALGCNTPTLEAKGRSAITHGRPAMMLTRAGLFALPLLLAGAVGCGQDDPDPPPDTDQPYHPLVEGAWWDYDHRGEWTERVTVAAATFEGQPAFIMSDSPNPSDDLRSDSIIMSVDGRVVRKTKDEYLVGAGSEVLTSSVTYGVGFTRFNEDWARQAVGYRETPEYERVETPPGGTSRPAEPRRHTFEIMSLSEPVMTGAGTYDCIVIKRTKDWEAEEDGLDADEAEAKTYWFARGVGKVQERNDETGNTEVLTDFFMPPAGG